MQVFAVFDVSDPTSVKAALEQNFPGNYYQIGTSTFFVATVGKTTRQVAEVIGLDGDRRLVVVPVASYWGVHNAELWEWLSVKMSQYGA